MGRTSRENDEDGSLCRDDLWRCRPEPRAAGRDCVQRLHSETFESSFLEVMSDEKGARCPVGRVGCPMCYDIVDRFNSDVEIPEHSEAFEHFCDGYINERWKASYEMLTGGQLDPMKEKIRCVSVSWE